VSSPSAGCREQLDERSSSWRWWLILIFPCRSLAVARAPISPWKSPISLTSCRPGAGFDSRRLPRTPLKINQLQKRFFTSATSPRGPPGSSEVGAGFRESRGGTPSTVRPTRGCRTAIFPDARSSRTTGGPWLSSSHRCSRPSGIPSSRRCWPRRRSLCQTSRHAARWGRTFRSISTRTTRWRWQRPWCGFDRSFSCSWRVGGTVGVG
jgi:hypothetical protein